MLLNSCEIAVDDSAMRVETSVSAMLTSPPKQPTPYSMKVPATMTLQKAQLAKMVEGVSEIKSFKHDNRNPLLRKKSSLEADYDTAVDEGQRSP